MAEEADRIALAVNEAIATAIGGGIVISFVGMTTYLDGEGNPCWSTFSAPDQSTILSRGLAETLNDNIASQCRAMFQRGE